MSIYVPLDELQRASADYGFAYLLTSSAAGKAPHAVAVQPVVADDHIRVDGLGRRTRANADACAAVALVWVPATIGQYSLIVDGQASPGAGDGLVIRPTRAVLHRPAPGSVEDSACGADCREIALPGAAGN